MCAFSTSFPGTTSTIFLTFPSGSPCKKAAPSPSTVPKQWSSTAITSQLGPQSTQISIFYSVYKCKTPYLNGQEHHKYGSQEEQRSRHKDGSMMHITRESIIMTRLDIPIRNVARCCAIPRSRHNFDNWRQDTCNSIEATRKRVTGTTLGAWENLWSICIKHTIHLIQGQYERFSYQLTHLA